MSLSDRLQRARTQQLIESGVLPTDYALEAEPVVAESIPVDEQQGLFAPITIEVQPTGLHLVPAPPADFTDMPRATAPRIARTAIRRVTSTWSTSSATRCISRVRPAARCGRCAGRWISPPRTDPSLQILLRHHLESSSSQRRRGHAFALHECARERLVVDLVTTARRRPCLQHRARCADRLGETNGVRRTARVPLGDVMSVDRAHRAVGEAACFGAGRG